MSERQIRNETDAASDPSVDGNGEAAKVRKRPRIGRKNFFLLAGIVLAVVLLFGVPFILHAMSHEKTDDAFIEGTVVPISPRVSGYVSKVYVDDNQWVHAGDTLVELDASDFQARLNASEAAHQSRKINVNLTRVSSTSGLDEAKANVEAAKASVQSAQAKVSAAESGFTQAKAQLASAQATLAQLDAEVVSAEAQHQRDADDLKRYRKMAKDLIASQQQLDHAAAAERISAANLDAVKGRVEAQKMVVAQVEAGLKAARDNVEQSKAGVEFSNAQLSQAQARLAAAEAAPDQVAFSRSQADAAEAELQQARLNLSYTKLVAPCNGYVTKKSVEPGSYVQVGQPLMTIVPPDVWLIANFKETQLTHIQPGQAVDIAVDVYPGVTFKGHVDSIQRGSGARFSLLPPENATGNYIKVVQRVPVKIVFDNSRQLRDYMLSPGMSAVPDVDISAKGTAPQAQALERTGAEASPPDAVAAESPGQSAAAVPLHPDSR